MLSIVGAYRLLLECHFLHLYDSNLFHEFSSEWKADKHQLRPVCFICVCVDPTESKVQKIRRFEVKAGNQWNSQYWFVNLTVMLTSQASLTLSLAIYITPLSHLLLLCICLFCVSMNVTRSLSCQNIQESFIGLWQHPSFLYTASQTIGTPMLAHNSGQPLVSAGFNLVTDSGW